MTGEKSSIDAVAAYIGGFGVRSRPLRAILTLLAGGSQPIEVLIAVTATPRRAVEDLLRVIGDDAVENSTGFRIRPNLIAAYRERFFLDDLAPASVDAAAPGDLAVPAGPAAPVGPGESAGRAERAASVELAGLAELIAGAPAPRRDLDHVAATAPTLARRVAWLRSTYDLAGRRVLFVGDHDLTSVALARACPGTEITVVDIDERILAYIDATARAEKLAIRTLFADLRFTLPPAAREWADIAVTDPPYTPDGVGLFLGRGLAGLRDRTNGVVVVAYGHSRLHPMLGFQVQQSMQQLGVVFETILPAFNRYDGAQAVGSASDLYVCAPTSRTWKTLDRLVEGFGTRIYTHGRQSVESAARVELGAATTVISDAPAAATPAASAGAPAADAADARKLGTRALFTGSDYLRDPRPDADVAVDLTADPGPLLLRALLAVTAARVRLVVPADHPDVATAGPRAALAALIAPKYTLAFAAATPASPASTGGNTRYTVVRAQLVGGGDAEPVARWLLERAHGRIGNVLREGFICAAAAQGRALSKNEARTGVRALLDEAEHDILELVSMEVPRARLETLLTAVRGAAARVPEVPSHLRSTSGRT